MSDHKKSPDHRKAHSPQKPIYLSVQYFEQKDGIYQGQVNGSYKKHGVGIFVNDDSMTYMGEWAMDQLDGEGLLVFPFGGFLLGSFRKNEVQGPGFLRLPHSKIMIGNFQNSQLHGICFIFYVQSKMWQVCEFAKGVLVGKLAEEKGEALMIPKSMAHYTELMMLFQRVLDKDLLPKKVIELRTIENGYLFCGFRDHGLGVVFHTNPFTYNLKIGQLDSEYNLDGYGRQIRDNGDVYDGYWKKSLLFRGYKYYKHKNQYLEVQTNENDYVRETVQISNGVGFPSTEVIRFRGARHFKNKQYFEKSQNLEKLRYIEYYRKLSFEEFNNSVFVQKTQRSSLVSQQQPIVDKPLQIKPSNVQQLESSLEMTRKNDYLNTLRSFRQKMSQQTSEIMDDIQSPQLSQRVEKARQETERSVKMSQNNENNLQTMNIQQNVVVSKVIEEKNEDQSDHKLQRISLNEKQSTSQLKSQVFEPFKMMDFENIRDNTIFNYQPQPLRERRSRKRIFSQDKPNYRQYRVNVMEYKQFLDVSGLNKQNIE